MTHKPFNRVAILGLGLIGSSLARAIVEKKAIGHVAAFDKSSSALQFGTDHHFIHSAHAYAGDAVENADLIIFALPPARLKKVAQEIAPFIKGGAVLTDVASVKRHAIADIMPYVPAYASYVPGHPVAGSEKNGVAAGRADLFENRQVILTPEEHAVQKDPAARVHHVWNMLGAHVNYMPAILHDRIYAYVSHLPQLLAYAAKSCMDVSDVAGLQRLAQSDVKLWVDIYQYNADFVIEATNEFMGFITQIVIELQESSGEAVQSPMSQTDKTPAQLLSHIIATCLIAATLRMEEEIGIPMHSFAGTGFADVTSPARTDAPETILAAISAQSGEVSTLLKKLHLKLEEIKTELLSGKPDKITMALALR